MQQLTRVSRLAIALILISASFRPAFCQQDSLLRGLLPDNSRIPGHPLRPGSAPGSAQQSKTAALAYRLVATGIWIGSPGADTLRISDSVSYQYSGNRGTGFDDTVTYYNWTTAGTRIPSSRTIQGYNSANQRIERITQNRTGNRWESYGRERRFPDANGADTLVLTDTFSRSGGVFGPYSMYRMQYYDPSARREAWSESGLWNRTTRAYDLTGRTTYTYDANGNLTGFLRESRQAGVLTPDQRVIYTYSATDKLQATWTQNMTAGVWSTSDSTSNSYDAAGNRVQTVKSVFVNGSLSTRQILGWEYYPGTSLQRLRTDSGWAASTNRWTLAPRTRYTHPVPGFHECSVSETWTANQWWPADSNSNENGTSSRYSVFQQFRYNLTGWYAVNYTYVTYSSSWVIDTMLIRNLVSPGDTLGNYTFQTNTYDSLNRLYRSDYRTWTNGSWNYRRLGSQARYYYEAYNDGLSVPKLPATDFELALFPVPANDRLFIHFGSDRQSAYTAAITDISGRTMRVWSGRSGASVETVPVPDLAPGVYFLTVNIAGSSATRRFSVVR